MVASTSYKSILNYIKRLGLATDESFSAKFPYYWSMDHIDNVITAYLFDDSIMTYQFSKDGNTITLIHQWFDSKQDGLTAYTSFYSLTDSNHKFMEEFKNSGMDFINFVSQGFHKDFVLRNYDYVAKCAISKISDDGLGKYAFTLYDCNRNGNIYIMKNIVQDGQHYTDKVGESLFEVGLDLLTQKSGLKMYNKKLGTITN